MKIIYIIFFLNIVFLYGNKIDVNTKKNQNINEVITVGYGISEDEALKNAFRSAIEQFVGVVIDTTTLVQNDELVKDEILTASNGYIEKYFIINKLNNNNLIEIKIKAYVKAQEVLNKIESLNISVKDFDGKNIYAKISTKIDSKRDSEKILEKVVGEFLNSKNIKDMLSVEITNIEIDDSNEKDQKIPINISYTLGVNNEIYEQKVHRLEQTFINLGAKLEKGIDFPRFEKHYYTEVEEFHAKNIENLKKISKAKTTIAILKDFKEEYRLDVWKFPIEWFNIYPFTQFSNIHYGINWAAKYRFCLDLIDSNNNVLKSENIDYKKNYSMNKAILSSTYSVSNINMNYENIAFIMPFISSSYVDNKEKKINLEHEIYIPISMLSKIKNFKIRLEEK